MLVTICSFAFFSCLGLSALIHDNLPRTLSSTGGSLLVLAQRSAS